MQLSNPYTLKRWSFQVMVFIWFLLIFLCSIKFYLDYKCQFDFFFNFSFCWLQNSLTSAEVLQDLQKIVTLTLWYNLVSKNRFNNKVAFRKYVHMGGKIPYTISLSLFYSWKMALALCADHCLPNLIYF